MGRVWTALAGAAFTLLLAAPSAWSYTFTLAGNGRAVRWFDGQKYNLAGNPANRSGLSQNEIFSAVVRGLQRWSGASGGRMTFDYWQGGDPSVYVPNSEYNGLSSIYFASNSTGTAGHLSGNVLGLTEVWYNTSTGEILEADIVLNDVSYRFTTDPRDTSGYGSNVAMSGTRGQRVFLENVITHELGHAFGMAHSGGLQSTMLFMESPEQAFLGCDDQIGIRALYPSGDAGSRGAMTGRVLNEGGAPVFGAHVLAISRTRGVVLASALSDRDGSYLIGGLEPSEYILMAEPFVAGPSALPAYYSGIDSKVCSGRPFSRTVLLEDGNNAKKIGVPAGGVVRAPDLTVRCTARPGAAILPAADGLMSAEGPVLADGVTGASGFGFVDQLGAWGQRSYSLHSIEGRLEVHVLGYSLYSPVNPILGLTDARGNEVQAQVSGQAFQGVSGYVNYDTVLVADGLPPGDYRLVVSPRPVDLSLFPAGPMAVDPSSFVMITGSINEGAPPLAAVLAPDARCRMSEEFPFYVSPPGGPVRRSTEEEEGGGCGSVREFKDGSGGPAGMSGVAVVAWLAPWGLMLLAARALLAQQRRRDLACSADRR